MRYTDNLLTIDLKGLAGLGTDILAVDETLLDEESGVVEPKLDIINDVSSVTGDGERRLTGFSEVTLGQLDIVRDPFGASKWGVS